MAKETYPPGQQEALRQLLEIEREARERISRAREEAARLIEEAQRQADVEVEEAHGKAVAEAENLVLEARQEVRGRKEGGAVPLEAGGQDIDALHRSAQETMDRAVAYLVDWVTATAE